MRVALMGRSLRGSYSGVVRYTDQLVRRLGPVLGQDLAVFLTRAADGLDGLPFRRVRAPFGTPNEYLRALWEQTVVPVEVARLRAQVYHSPNYILPLAVRCPTVVTIHDLFYLEPQLHRLRSHLYLTALANHAIAHADRVICVSGYTRDQLLERFPKAAPRVRVIGEGVDPSFREATGAEVARARAWLGVEAPYVLYVGTIEPRKNLPRLLRAFEAAVVRGGLPHHLVLAGARGWRNGPLLDVHRASSIPERIHFPGYVAEDLLPALYAGADVFAYPSLGEGYGLPPLEAMACGAAVLTSDGSALAETAGGAALLVDPGDEEAIARGLERLLGDPEERRRRVELGLRQAALHTWDRTAEATLAVYREVAA
jgi:glycosyltransferase involved in cell wall biosynthesis